MLPIVPRPVGQLVTALKGGEPLELLLMLVLVLMLPHLDAFLWASREDCSPIPVGRVMRRYPIPSSDGVGSYNVLVTSPRI